MKEKDLGNVLYQSIMMRSNLFRTLPQCWHVHGLVESNISGLSSNIFAKYYGGVSNKKH